MILISWDGAGFVATSRLLAEGKLPNLERMIREGAWSDGMVSSFPTKTAAAHAVLFTGAFGHASGITGNTLLRLPREAHSYLDTESGYFSTPLRVDPTWITAARAGLSAYALHATQAYPFDGLERALAPSERERVFVVHGYTGVGLRGETIVPQTIEPPSEAWRLPEARGAEARTFRFDVGQSTFFGLLFDDPIDPATGIDTLGVVREETASVFEARVKPGEHGGFSSPIPATLAGKEVFFSLRLFELAAEDERVLLYRSGAAEIAVSNPSFPAADLPLVQAFDGNGGVDAYGQRDFGPLLVDGGEGQAERRLLETEAHLLEQLLRQAELALSSDYDLVVLYSPVSDDVAHELWGYLTPGLDGYEGKVASRLWEFLTEAFMLQDRLLGRALDAARRDEAHVILVSDHGMAGTDRLVHLNEALRRAALLALRDDGSIDLSATRALAPPLADTSIAVNLVDRKGGIVPLEEKADVLRRVRRVLASLTDPDTGERIVTAFFEPSTSGLLQPGGSSTGHLFLDVAPRYYPSTETGGEALVSRTEPTGQHIFVPTRREMLAICAAWGPRVTPGVHWGKVRAIDVAATVLDLLGLEAASALPGRSLVPESGLLQTARE